MNIAPAVVTKRQPAIGGDFIAAEDSVYGVATASEKVSGHVAATLGSGEDATPDQAPWAGEMDRANLVHGPFQRLGNNGPAFCQGHSQSIEIRCDETPLAAVIDVAETSIPSLWSRPVEGSAVSHEAHGQMAWPKCGCVYFTRRRKFV